MRFFPKDKKRLFIGIVIAIIFLLLISDKDDNKNMAVINTEKPSSEELHSRQISIDPQPRSGRLIGMAISEGSIGFEKAFNLAYNTGVRAVELPVVWDDSEPKPGEYVSGWLPTANLYYPKAGVRLALSLNPIDTNNLRLPKDLKGKVLNDPEVISRYKSFIDFVAGQLPDSDVFFVSIGNEIDVYLGSSDKLWQQYTEFFSLVAPHVREKFPNAVVGSKITYDGIIGLKDKVGNFNSYADVAMVTYYPFKKGSFVVRDPMTVYDDFEDIISLYPDKKIYFAEIGYPSGGPNESSEEKQAQFIRHTFAAWDSHRLDIPFLNFQWLHDASPETVAGWQKYYGFKDKKFASFLGSLGIRTFDGKDKQAFVQFGKEAKARGW